MLARPGPEDLLAVGFLLPTPVAPKLLRDRAEDRLSVGGLPLCRYERAAAMSFFIGFFLFLDRAASFHFGSVAKSHTQMPSAASSRRSRPCRVRDHFRLKIICKF